MSIFRRLFGGATEPDPGLDPAPDAARDAAPTADTATVRRIVSQLEALPPERARYLAAASYVLARVANADLVMSPEETGFMERTLVEESGIGEAEAVLVVEAAKQQARLFGSTEDYLVTREFKRISDPEQRLRLLRACFLAAAADSSISSAEGRDAQPDRERARHRRGGTRRAPERVRRPAVRGPGVAGGARCGRGTRLTRPAAAPAAARSARG